MPRYEFSEGTSNKFWQIELDGSSFTTCYGKIGTDGQTTLKEYDSPAQAKKEYEKLIAEKVKKGYELASDEAPTERPVAKPAPAPKAKKAKAEVFALPAVAGAVRFELSEGTANKFWEIMLEGDGFTTRYGKIGTDGTTSKKSFDSAEQARREYDKLIAEEKKGYERAGAASEAGDDAEANDDADVGSSWKRIEGWLKTNAPAGFKSLRKGAPLALIEKTEATLGVRLPNEVREFYLIHDGQNDSGPDLFDGWQCLPLDQIVSQWKIWQDLLDGGDFEGQHCTPAKGIKNDWWNGKWIPLTHDGGGNHHCVDLDPAKGGTAGQVIQMWHDSDDRPLLAKSFAEWFAKEAEAIEAGEYDFEV